MHRHLAAGLAATALVAAGCGGAHKTIKTTGTPKSVGTVLALQADKTQLKYDKSSLSAGPGKVTIAMHNPSSLPHDVAIQGNGVNVIGKVVNQGGVSTASATLKAGTYTFYCSVDGHRAAGMQGTLTIK